ncbi:MAG: NAD+ synthase [Actinomycetota bacterium]|nr:NAD+ synthase [Actinomycetota bacterium]
MLRLALAQLDLTVGALAENRKRIADACADAARAGADLVLAPELGISGYPPEDLLLRPSFLRACQAEAELLAGEVELPLIVGCPWLDVDRVRNSALVLAGGQIVARYDKRELPNYGVFDEERTFSPGRGSLHIEVPDGALSLTVCEDVWLPDSVGEAAALGAACVLNISASPYHLGKGEAREEMLATRARDGLCAVAYCNLVGGQDELVFDGRSAVFGPDGAVLARAASFVEELLVCDVDLDASVHERLRDSRLRRGRRHRVHPPVTIELPLGGEHAPLAPSIALPPAGQAAELWAALRVGLIDYVSKNGFERVLLGLSGGIDSALVAALAADALGADRVEAVSMPTRYNSEGTRSDARLVAERLGIAFREVAIEDLRLSFEGALPGTSGLAAENLQARIRGVLLMTLSNQHGWLVLTTGNKSETAVGYSTLYGDSAGGFAPIKDVPKTLVFALARYINQQAGRELIPASIIERPPSAELRDDQRDDQSLPPYEQLDPMIEAYVEDDLSPEEIARRGLATLEVARRVARLVDLAEYKRRQAPPGIKVHTKAFGRDRRLPITNRFGR